MSCEHLDRVAVIYPAKIREVPRVAGATGDFPEVAARHQGVTLTEPTLTDSGAVGLCPNCLVSALESVARQGENIGAISLAEGA